MRLTTKLLVPLGTLGLLLAACGGDDTDGAAAADGAGGAVTISGSSTVEPISSAVAEAFAAQHPDVPISVDGPGTGDGFELFCRGETDISNASRPIKDEEIEACEANGVEYVELKVAIDGISVITAPEFDAVGCLSFADMYALVGPESAGIGSWSDAATLGEEVGAEHAPDFPDRDLVITAPGEESGTYDTFVELVLADIAEERGQEPATRPDYQASPNDNVIIEGVEGSDSSFGWVGYSFYEQNAEALRAFEIDAGGADGCVAPTAETIADGSYPLARPLFIYVNRGRAEANPGVVAFVDFHLGAGIEKVAEVGYVALPADELAATREAWEGR